MKRNIKSLRHAPTPISSRRGLNNGQKMPASRIGNSQFTRNESPASSLKTYPNAAGGSRTTLGAQYLLEPGETIIASSRDVSAGTIGFFGFGVNDAYDLYLLDKSGGGYILVVFMKLQFVFEDFNKNIWTQSEKVDFANNFKKAINAVWGNKVLKVARNGKKISLQFRFEMILDQWCITEHWEIHVKKVTGFSQSWVNPYTGKVQLDSQDLTPTEKSYPSGFKGTKGKQRGVVHEFGHMLGLPDEYDIVNGPHSNDFGSIMNRGESVLSRHSSQYINWLNNVLKENKIQ